MTTYEHSEIKRTHLCMFVYDHSKIKQKDFNMQKLTFLNVLKMKKLKIERNKTHPMEKLEHIDWALNDEESINKQNRSG